MSHVSRWTPVAFALIAALCSACAGKELKRSNALELLRAHQDASVERKLFFILHAPLYLAGQEGELYKSLERAGWVTIQRPQNIVVMNGRRPAELLTQKILTLGPCGAQPRCAFVPVAKRTIGEVTGVVQQEQNAVVEFTWKWALTLVGEELASAGVNFAQLHDVYGPFDPALALPAQAAFTLFDDGWRVQEVSWYVRR